MRTIPLPARASSERTRRLSIQSRFMVYFGIVVVGLMSVVILLVGHRQSRSMLHQTEMRGVAVAHSIAAVVTNALLSYDYPSLQRASDDAKDDTGVAYVVILDKESQVAGYSGRPELQGQHLDDPVSLAVEDTEGAFIQHIAADPKRGFDSGYLDIAVPVFVDSSPVKWGTIRVGLSLDMMEADLARTRRDLALLGIAAVCIVLLTARYFTSRITRPLKGLAEATSVIARGDLDHLVDDDLVGELGDLARSFNKMTNDLKRSRDAVRYQNQHLENMVQERTAALREKARELEKANEELKEVDRLKSDFLSNVSHELRTPLTSIRSFTEIMLDDGERGEFLAIVASQADRLTRLISDLLDLSKIEAGEFHCQLESMSLREQVVRPCIETLRTLAAEKDVHLVAHFPEDLPEVMGDADRLSQVLTNLVDNAIKFTPPGGEVRVHAEVTEGRRQVDSTANFAGMESDTPELGQYLLIRVQDTGVGIHVSDQQRIFEKFGQVGNVLTNKPQGTGLGLAISGNIMVQHGGALWVESIPDEGSTFSFTIPLAAEAAEKGQSGRFTPVREPEERPESLLGDTAELVEALERASTGRRVLVVDDERSIVQSITEVLEPLGYRAVVCNSGSQAVAKARDLKPDCILLDLMMPEINGYDVLRLLKGEPETADIPVVVLGAEDEDRKAHELGAAQYVRKPLPRGELMASVKTTV